MARKTVVARIGNYAAPVDVEGMDAGEKAFFKAKPTSEKAYLADQAKRVNVARAKRGVKPVPTPGTKAYRQ